MERFHPVAKLHLEKFGREIMLIEDVFFPKDAVEQADQEEDVRRIRRVDNIKSMPAPYLQTEQKGHKKRDAILCQVGKILIAYSGQRVAINIYSIDARSSFAISFPSFRTDDAHLEAVFAQGDSFRPDAPIRGRGHIFYEHEHFTDFC